MNTPLLQLENVKTHFAVERGLIFRRKLGVVRAVDGVSLTLQQGEILGLVGESGCGKSTLGRTILQLVPATEGAVILAGRNLTALRGNALRATRADFQMIFQDPYASLNPRMTVSDLLGEALRSHRRVSGTDLPRKVRELMDKVGLSPRGAGKYPHEFSGGQRQRIAIARALAVEPKLIVADEPVSALDVSIQAQIINLLGKLSREMQLTLIFISHDLSVVKHISHRIAVMYLGRIVELGPAMQVMERPLHPYTKSLVSAVPVPDPERERERQRIILSGDPPSPMNPPAGCPFHPRCAFAVNDCSKVVPKLEAFDENQEAACIRMREINGSVPVA
ncbi:MAG TPA: oligopeptide/dipeptide ABC transporter ATP-binding protein [Verrucomicrobiae bacterium]|nr:oligopeptide/dipeptide ABC transporter ATP-binding protein [Verrucomicrobiae bacterium]